METSGVSTRHIEELMRDISAPIYDEKGKFFGEETNTEYGRSFVNVQKPKYSKREVRTKEEVFVPESAESPIFVPEREILKH